MTRDVEHIILNKEFAELTAIELDLIQEWVENEEEFNLHKAILLEAPTLDSDILPPPSLKSTLMADFAQQHAKAATTGGTQESEKKKVISLYVRVAWSIAAVFLLGLLVYPMLQEDTVFEANKKTPLAQKEDISAEQDQVDTKPLAVLEKSEQSNVNQKQLKQKKDMVTANSLDEAPSPQDAISIVSEDQSEEMKVDGNALSVESARVDQMAFSAEPNYSFSAPPATTTTTLSQTAEPLMDADAFVHADILTTKDVLKSNRQIVADKPQILDLLYTSF